MLTASAESLASEHDWVKESTLIERAFALGICRWGAVRLRRWMTDMIRRRVTERRTQDV
jgi:hypothetical protein